MPRWSPETGGIQVLDGFIVGGGVTCYGIKGGTVSIDPPSIATISRGAATGTITGLATGDRVIVQPPVALNDDLIFAGARVTAANTLTVYLYNPTGLAIDDAAQTWEYLWFDLTE